MEKFPDVELSIYGLGAVDPQFQQISEVERLMNEFEAHEGQEGEFVQHYKEIAEKSKNPLIKFLLRLIISDEEKHQVAIHAIL